MCENGDILKDIPDGDLPKLAKMYKKHVDWAPHVSSFVHSIIKWKQSEKHKDDVTFTSLNDKWKIDGTIIVFLHYFGATFIFTLDEKCENLYEGLMKTNRIDFVTGTWFYNTHEKHVPTLLKVVNEKNLVVKTEIRCRMYTLSSNEAKHLTIDCPPDVYFKRLDRSAAAQINSVWPHKRENSEKFITTLIEMNGGWGIFSKSTDELCAWVVRQCFDQIGMLQTLEAYKRKGLGALVVKVLAKQMGKNDQCPFATVAAYNVASRSLFQQVGFHDIGEDVDLFVQLK